MLKPRHAHPLHKRFALHPLTLMGVLAAGVLLIASTFPTSAETLQVSATVHAEPPTQPAVITSPADGTHVNAPEYEVSGTCPDGAYVKIYRNDAFAGVAPCEGGAFRLPLSLEPGANVLQARVFNVTDDEGPTSPSVTVYYDYTTVTPEEPTTVPISLTIETIDGQHYQSGKTFQVSKWPTVTGTAPPYSKIIVTFHSDPITCLTRASAHGWWTCTSGAALPPGDHKVDAEAITPDGRHLAIWGAPLFIVVPTRPSLLRLDPLRSGGSSTTTLPSEEHPLTIDVPYRYQTHYVGDLWNWDVTLRAGSPPYEVVIEWGDGQTTSRQRTEEGAFTISHAYSRPGTYRPLIRVTDGNKATVSVLQLLALVKDTSGQAATTKSAPPSGLQQYLWMVWPAYGVLLLMVVSFWLGELEIMHRFKRTHAPRRS